MKTIRKKSLALVGASTLAISLLVTPPTTVVNASGTERPWKVTLPHNNGNYYFPFRKKQTNEDRGYIYLKTCDSKDGVSAWFCSGTGLSSAMRCSNIVSMKAPKNRTVFYQSNSKKGSSVDMAIENSSSTWLKRDHASGIVNYK